MCLIWAPVSTGSRENPASIDRNWLQESPRSSLQPRTSFMRTKQWPSQQYRRALRHNLDHRYVRTREANGRELSYIEGWYAISEANRKGESSVVNETDSGLLLAERQCCVSSCRRKASGYGYRSGYAAFEQVIGPQQKFITIIKDRKFRLACLPSSEACCLHKSIFLFFFHH